MIFSLTLTERIKKKTQRIKQFIFCHLKSSPSGSVNSLDIVPNSNNISHTNHPKSFQTQLQLHSCCMMTCAITGGHDTLPRDHHHVRNGHPQPVQLPLPSLPPPKPPHRIFGMRGSDIDKYSRVLFPIMFVRSRLQFISPQYCLRSLQFRLLLRIS